MLRVGPHSVLRLLIESSDFHLDQIGLQFTRMPLLLMRLQANVLSEFYLSLNCAGIEPIFGGIHHEFFLELAVVLAVQICELK